MSKWYYYGFKETGKIWRTKNALKGNPSTEYHLLILNKKEAKDLAKISGKKIINLTPKTKMAKDKKKKKGKEGKESKEAKPKKGNSKAKSSSSDGQRKFAGSLNLAKLQHVIMEKKNKKGKKIKVLLLPIDKNYIEVAKDKDGNATGGLYLNISVITREEQDDYGQNGFIAQNGNKKWSECSDKEKEAFNKLPILGNIKDFQSAPASGGNEASGSAGSVDEHDDLPF